MRAGTESVHIASCESKPKFDLDLASTEAVPVTWVLSLHSHWQTVMPKSSPKTHLIKNQIFYASGSTSREGCLLRRKKAEKCFLVCTLKTTTVYFIIYFWVIFQIYRIT